jgi:hypothetical protein
MSSRESLVGASGADPRRGYADAQRRRCGRAGPTDAEDAWAMQRVERRRATFICDARRSPTALLQRATPPPTAPRPAPPVRREMPELSGTTRSGSDGTRTRDLRRDRPRRPKRRLTTIDDDRLQTTTFWASPETAPHVGAGLAAATFGPHSGHKPVARTSPRHVEHERMSEEASGYRAKDRSLDELMDDFDRGLPQGEGRGSDPTLVGFQYRVAKAQQR